jgi:diguanylate cyclase (GGDEF)-like protein
LPNGRALYARLEQEVARVAQQCAPLTVICLNLVGLRGINDSYGYRAGDRMLSEVAARLDTVLRDTLMLSRIAGDEFICLVADNRASDADALYERARLEVENLSVEVRPGLHARVGLSFGLARYPDEGQTIDELLRAAASAARQHSKNYCVAQPSNLRLAQSPSEKAVPATGALVQ